MQQRQLRLGDILDDYCPRERRVTNHVIVAMIGEDVKQVRCTTCDADHDFKHAKVPRQRRKTETPAALYAQVLATGPKRVTHDAPPPAAAGNRRDGHPRRRADRIARARAPACRRRQPRSRRRRPHRRPATRVTADRTRMPAKRKKDRFTGGSFARRCRRSTAAPPPTRAIPEFTIRQPAGRPANRFRGPRHARGGGGGGQQFPGNRSGGGNGFGGPRGNGGGMRSNGGGRPQQGPGGGQARRNGPGRRRQ